MAAALRAVWARRPASEAAWRAAGAARGLRAALVSRYGDDGNVLVARLEAISKLTDRRSAKLALDATELLLAYHSGKATQAMEVSTSEDEPLRVIQVVLTK